eukprot:6201878-Pleurochrysis_carterae.AAC.1
MQYSFCGFRKRVIAGLVHPQTPNLCAFDSSATHTRVKTSKTSGLITMRFATTISHIERYFRFSSERDGPSSVFAARTYLVSEPEDRKDLDADVLADCCHG